MDDTDTATAADATSGAWEAGAGVGRPLPEARLIEAGRIRRARPQPRAWFDPEELENLAASIGEHGILAPLIVRPDPEHAGEFLLVVGERRLRAAQALGLAEVPVLVRIGINNDEAFVAALVENLQRADLTSDERFNALKYLEGRGLSQREIGRRLGYDHSTINRQMRIHGDPILGPAVAAAWIKASQGQELLQVPPAEQGPLIELIVARRRAGRPISMSELRATVRAVAQEPIDTPPDLSSRLERADPFALSPPSIKHPVPPEGTEERDVSQMVARARTLVAHFEQELDALQGYVCHPQIKPQLHRVQQLLIDALPSEDRQG